MIIIYYNSYAVDQKTEYYLGSMSGLLGHQGGRAQLACAGGRGRLTATTSGWRETGKLSNTFRKDRGFYYDDGF